MRHMAQQFRTRRFRAGGYTTFATAIVIAIAVAANLLAGALPESVTQQDMTQAQIYTLSDQTRRIVSAIEKDVTLYQVAVSGNENESVRAFLKRYADLSDHISIETADPIENPSFLKTYGQNMSINSVIIQSGDKYRIVDYNDIYVVDYSYDYYSGGFSNTTSFNGEQEITSAIYYVVSDSLPVVYTLTGHGEEAISETVLNLLSQQNMEQQSLSLLTEEAVPEDAAAVVVSVPQSDISEDEAERLKEYLAAGGQMILMTDQLDAETFPNLLSVTESMGLTVGEGMVIEGDASRCVRGYNYYILPEITSHEITNPLIDGGYYIMTPMAQPLEETADSTADVTTLLTTSSKAYAKMAGYDMQTTEKEDGDTDGPFYVGMLSEKNGARLAWFSTPLLLDASTNSIIGGSNYDLFLNTLSYACAQEDSISIRAKSLDVEALVVPQQTASTLSVLVVGVIPALLVAAGIVIVVRRKRK